MKVSALIVTIAVLAGCGGKGVDEGPIRLEKIGTIEGPSADGGFLGLPLISGRSTSGERIAVTPWESPMPPVYVIGAAGEIVDTLATIGPGPGQVEYPEIAIAGLGDTIILVDRTKLHFFAPDHRFVRSVPFSFSGSWGGVQLPNGEVVLASASVGGRPTLVAAISPADGSERWTIEGPQFDRSAPLPNVRIAAGTDGTIWTVKSMGTLELTQYSASGKRGRTLTPQAEWFLPFQRAEGTAKPRPPFGYVTGFWIDSAGRGWVVAQTGDPEWASAEGEVVRAEGQDIFVPKSYSDVRDGIIAVYDLTNGTELALWRRDSIFGRDAEPGLLYEWRTDDDGWHQIDLFKVVPRF
jgi:hypothetical protein